MNIFIATKEFVSLFVDEWEWEMGLESFLILIAAVR
jgi:hypothetical protein